MKKTICPFCNKREAVERHETDTTIVIYSCRSKECMIKAEKKANSWRR